MAFCANCGAQGEGRFCPKCGSPLGAAPTPGATPGYAPPPAAPVQSAGLENNMAAALCYILGIVTGILFLVLEPYNKDKTIRFHAFQSIFFFIAVIIFDIAVGIVIRILYAIPFLGWLAFIVWPIVGLALFLCWLFVMFKAYNGEKFKLPIIGDLAEKQA
jgi:uncharacterized membrane protein